MNATPNPALNARLEWSDASLVGAFAYIKRRWTDGHRRAALCRVVRRMLSKPLSFMEQLEDRRLVCAESVVVTPGGAAVLTLSPAHQSTPPRALPNTPAVPRPLHGRK